MQRELETLRLGPVLNTLVVTGPSPDGSHLALEEGAYVDVLEPAGASLAGACLCRTQAPDPKNRDVGFYDAALLQTEEQVYERFMAEENARLAAELEAQQQAKQDEADSYERALRQRMKDKAEADRKQRAIDAENRRIEAERLQRELEERRAREAEEARVREEARQRDVAEKARRLAEEKQARENDARQNKAAWDRKELEVRDAEELR